MIVALEVGETTTEIGVEVTLVGETFTELEELPYQVSVLYQVSVW